MDPFQQFSDWYNHESDNSGAFIPSACCLSATGLDDYPDARFVSLKEMIDKTFIVTGPVSSRKGLEIMKSNKVAITFWWPATQRQVRVQGNAIRISDEQADKYFSQRDTDAQIVSMISEQGKPLNSPEDLLKKFEEAKSLFTNKPITRPSNWSGYAIHPVRMEFMEFMPSRFHNRKLYELINEEWMQSTIQP